MAGNRTTANGQCLWFSEQGDQSEQFSQMSNGMRPGRSFVTDGELGPSLRITAVDQGYAAYGYPRVRITAHHHNLAGVGGTVFITGVSGITPNINGAQDVIANYVTSGVTVAGGSGSNLSLNWGTPHYMATGDFVRVWNCSAFTPGTEFQITVLDPQTMTLNGSSVYSAAKCPSPAVYDNSHLLIYNSTTASGSYSGGATVQLAPKGFEIHMLEHGTGTWPNDYLQGLIESGTTNPNYNRISFGLKCSGFTFTQPANGSGFQVGTYVNAQPPGNHADGAHYYHFIAGQALNGRTAFYTINRHPNTDNLRNLMEYPDNASQYSGWLPNAIPDNYMYDLTSIYFASNGTWSNQPFSCEILAPVTMSEVDNEADSYVMSTGGVYDPTKQQYDIWASTPQFLAKPTAYNWRYSFSSSCHALGWENCTKGGTLLSMAQSAPAGLLWTLPSATEENNLWVAVQPTYLVDSVTWQSGTNVVVTPQQGHDFQTGDVVTLAGVPGVPSGNYTITVPAMRHFRFDDGSLTAIDVAANTGVVTVTTSTPHGLLPGQEIYISRTVPSPFALEHAFVTSVPSPTTLTYSSTWTGGGLHYGPADLPHAFITPLPSFSVTGVNGSGVEPTFNWQTAISEADGPHCANCGTAVSFSPVRFTEIYIPKDSSGVYNGPDFNWVVPAATVGQPYSATLSASGGTPPYTFSFASPDVTTGNNYTIPPGLTVNSNGTITGTPTAATGGWFYVKLTDSAGLSVTKSISLWANSPEGGVVIPPASPSPTTFSACDLNKDGVVNSQDVQLMINVALGQAACSSTYDLNGDGQCNVVDVQRVINAADGGSCVTGQ